MEAFSVPAMFMAKPGLLGHFFSRNKQGLLSLQPDGTFTMTGYDKVYCAPCRMRALAIWRGS